MPIPYDEIEGFGSIGTFSSGLSFMDLVAVNGYLPYLPLSKFTSLIWISKLMADQMTYRCNTLPVES